jgi:hypothetical protein
MATPLARAPLPRPLLRPVHAVRLPVARRRLRMAPVAAGEGAAGPALRTCKNCKQQYDPAANHPSACRFHTAHFGGELSCAARNQDIQVQLHIRLGLPKVKIGSLFSAQFSSRFIKLLWTSVPNSHSNVKASVS